MVENKILERKLVECTQKRTAIVEIANSISEEQAREDVKNLFMRGILEMKDGDRYYYRNHSIKELPLGSMEPDSRVEFDGFHAKEYKLNNRVFYNVFNDFNIDEIASYSFLRHFYPKKSFYFKITEIRSKIILLESTKVDEPLEEDDIIDIIKDGCISMSREDTNVKFEITDPGSGGIAHYRIEPEVELVPFKI